MSDTHDNDLKLYIICMTVVYAICGGVAIGAVRYLMDAL